MKKINIGILGYGTIGSAVDKLISQNKNLISVRTGIELNVARVCDVSSNVRHPLLTRDAYKIIDDPEISVVVEAIGGEKPALDFILHAISSSKHVVTSNKEVIALHGPKIIKAAANKGVCVRFEAAVGGGIPVVSALYSDLSANDITEVYGIVNGTTNYILSKMTYEGTEFRDALKEAQKRGYAEANPEKDLKGFDASYKAAILASVAFRSNVDWKNVYFEGINKIEYEDVVYAGEIGYIIKLLAVAKKIDSKLCEVRVHPTFIPKEHPLASVSGPMNAIYIKGNAVGELMFYGQGAGGMPTASAVVSDIIAVTNYKASACCLPADRNGFGTLKIKSISEIESRYYIRISVVDKPGVLSQISKIFADYKVSIAAVMQKEAKNGIVTLVIIVHKSLEKNFHKAISKIKKLSVVDNIGNIIRVGL